MTRGDNYWLIVYCLWTGTMVPFFQSSGKILDFTQFWNITESGFSILIEMPSYSGNLFAPNDWIIFSSFSLSKVISFNLISAWYVLDFGRALLICRGWHCLLENSLNKLAFSKKLVINLPLKVYWCRFENLPLPWSLYENNMLKISC